MSLSMRALVAAITCVTTGLAASGGAVAVTPSEAPPGGLSLWCAVHNLPFYDNVPLGETFLGTGTDFKAGERLSISVTATWGTPTSFAMQIPDGTTVATTAIPGTVTYTFPADVVNGTIRLNTFGGGVLANWGCERTEVESGPTVVFTSGDPVVEESGVVEHTYTYSIANPGVGVPVMDLACGPVGTPLPIQPTNTASGGSFRCVFPDGPRQYSVLARARNSAGVTGEVASQMVTVTNVAPAVQLLPLVATGLTGQPVSFSGIAEDASVLDQLAGFRWREDGGEFTTGLAPSPHMFTATMPTCGSATVTLQATDKDGGESSISTAALEVYDATFEAPLDPDATNVVTRGRVVPVKMTIGCSGANLEGLTPSIELVAGDLVDNVTPDSGQSVVDTYVVGVDSAGVMREVGHQYVYNLRVPSSATAGSRFTIRVRPFGAGTPSITALLEVQAS